MRKQLTSFFILLAITQCSTLNETGIARGFGGGGGGGGRGFSGGGFSGDRGFDGGSRGDEGYRGNSDYGGERMGYDNYRDFDQRADDFLRGGDAYGMGARDFNNVHSDTAAGYSHVPDADLRASADHEYAPMETQRSLATDSGFGRIATAARGVPTYRMTPAAMVDRGDAVRSNFNDYGLYNRGWWDNHPNAWRYPYYGDGYWPWSYTGWPYLAGFWGMSSGMSLPEYDYGDNITYNNNEVYYGSQPTCTTEQYYDQAQQLAQSVEPTSTVVAQQQPSGSFTIDGKPPNAESWKSLGVFSLTQGGQTNSTSLFQLAVDKNGTIRGNYENELTGAVQAVQGSVDKKTMRAAWTVGDSKDVVYDTGVANLTKAQAPVLVHFSKTRTEQWNLVRLQPPPSAPSKKSTQPQPG